MLYSQYLFIHTTLIKTKKLLPRCGLEVELIIAGNAVSKRRRLAWEDVSCQAVYKKCQQSNCHSFYLLF